MTAYDKVKTLVEKAERLLYLYSFDYPEIDIDTIVVLEHELPNDIVALKAELLTMFEEEQHDY